MSKVRKFFWDEPYLFWIFSDGVIQRCILEVEMMSILEYGHSSPVGDHHCGTLKTHKIIQCGHY